MSKCIITLPSMTFAQKARLILTANRIEASVLKLPPPLSDKGCAWGISLDCEKTKDATRILTVSDLPYKKVWRQEE